MSALPNFPWCDNYTVELTGWLWKLGGNNKSFQKRYFVLDEANLYYCKSLKAKQPAGTVPKKDIVGVCERSNVTESKQVQGRYLFDIRCVEGTQVVAVLDRLLGCSLLQMCTCRVHDRAYRVAAETNEVRQKWIQGLKGSIRTKITKQGWLMESKDGKSGKKRWCVLTPVAFTAYKEVRILSVCIIWS